MSDELAQDEEDAEDYDLEALERRTGARMSDDEDEDEDDRTLVSSRRGPGSLSEDVVFEIGDEEEQGSDDDETGNKRRPERKMSREGGTVHERQGLMEE